MGRKAFNVGHERREDNSDKYNKLDSAVSVAGLRGSAISSNGNGNADVNGSGNNAKKRRHSDGLNVYHPKINDVITPEVDKISKSQEKKARKKARQRSSTSNLNANIFSDVLSNSRRGPKRLRVESDSGEDSDEVSDLSKEEDDSDISSSVSVTELETRAAQDKKSSPKNKKSFQQKMDESSSRRSSSSDDDVDIDSEGSGVTLNSDDDELPDDDEMSDEDEMEEEDDGFLVDDNEAEDESEDEEEGIIRETDMLCEDEDEEDSLEDEAEHEKGAICRIHVNIDGYNTQCATQNCVVLESVKTQRSGKPFELFQFTDTTNHSVQTGLNALQWLIAPIDVQTFFKDIFQRRAMIVLRKSSDYYENFFGISRFVEMLQKHNLQYTKNINIALYKSNKRVTLNGRGRVYPRVIQEHLAEGRSVQCVNPQVFDDHIWYLCDVLQEVFGCFVGANNYLTPANASGFAPHWDDIDAFIVQVEGRKHWTVASSKNSQQLPLFSSDNFTDEIFKSENVAYSGWLEQGDVLYIPRGFIHKAHTDKQTFSHHVTISVCQNHSFGDFFEMATEEVLGAVTDRLKIARSSLPPLLYDMLGEAGVEYTSEETSEEKFIKPCHRIAQQICETTEMLLPEIVDKACRDFLRKALPPFLAPYERKYSCYGDHSIALLGPMLKFENMNFRLIRKHVQRLCYDADEDGRPFIAHRAGNSRVYEERVGDDGGEDKSAFVYIHPDLEPGFIELYDTYPEFMTLDDFKIDTEQAKDLVRTLFQHGLLLAVPLTDLSAMKKKALGTVNGTPAIGLANQDRDQQMDDSGGGSDGGESQETPNSSAGRNSRNQNTPLSKKARNRRNRKKNKNLNASK